MKDVCRNLLLVMLLFTLFPQTSFAVKTSSSGVTLASEGDYPCKEDAAKVTCNEINKMLTDSAMNGEFHQRLLKL